MIKDNSAIRSLAAALHIGQFDKRGVPYIDHLEAVASILQHRWPDATQDEVDAAWLHDALEDTPIDARDLKSNGVSDRTIEIVSAVTRPLDVPYLAWIEALASSGDASVLRVKLADNEHNSDPTRTLPGRDMVAQRYAPARAILEAALRNLEVT